MRTLLTTLVALSALLSADVLRAKEAPQPPPITPPTAEEIEISIRLGVSYLIDSQNKTGSWGSAWETKDLNVTATTPGSHHAFRAAVSAMCIEALIEADDPRPEAKEALRRGEDWLLANLRRVKRADPGVIYNIWTHAMAIQALAAMHAHAEGDSDRQEKILDLIRHQVDLLERYESVYGGWGYYDFATRTQHPGSKSNSFTTATVLIGLDRAKPLGISIAEKVEKRAMRVIYQQQKPDFTYLYSGYHAPSRLMHPVNRPSGGLGRSQVCNAALRIYGDEKITDDVLTHWLDRLFSRGGWLDMGRKRPIPHEAWCKVAGYFYYYGHYYAALNLEMLPKEQQPRYQGYMAHTLMAVQEKNGSWWDFPLYNYHYAYGTAFGLMSMVRCRPHVEENAQATGSDTETKVAEVAAQ